MQTIIRSLTVLDSSLFLGDVWIRFIWLKPRSHSAEDIGKTANANANCWVGPKHLALRRLDES